MPMAGGLMGYGYQCGMLWGATLAAGAQAYRLFGTGPQAETQAVITAQRIVEAFRDRNKHIDCSEITEMNWKEASSSAHVLKFFLKGGPIVCFSMTANYAQIAFNEINLALAEKETEAPPPPISCASMLAQKMGVSDMHAVMAAGFAGGIGLSGGACGALGAAIWIIGINSDEEEDGKNDNKSLNALYENPNALAAMDRFLKSADYEFECSNIVGRKFENVNDHADYLQAGGCAKIIEALAAV
jgi:hypothetical protein